MSGTEAWDARTPRTAVIAAGDEETRVLLRGLLRLHHVRVLGESDGARTGVELLRKHHPTHLIADTQLSEGSTQDLVARGREAAPGVRVILVASATRAPPSGTADVVLMRPFRIRQLADALESNPTAQDGPTAVPSS